MKIHYALMSCDENPYYSDFMPVVTEAWNRIGITPVYMVTQEGPVTDYNSGRPNGNQIVFRQQEIPGINKPFHGLNGRIWLWKLLPPECNCIISDIDMMPLSSDYFNGTAAKYDDDHIVSYCDDAKTRFGQIAACYVLANAGLMQKLIAEDTFESFLKERAENTGQGWGGDQWYLEHLCDKHDQSKVVKLVRGWNAGGEADHRLDRVNWNRYNMQDVRAGRVYDAHLLRPYKDHKAKIDALLDK
jgi:hypothetical protein